jgi:L-ascorbate metabolism protein UlaG (beta-lactamase superfamily)
MENQNMLKKVIISVIILSVSGGCASMRYTKYGKNPGGDRLERIMKSPNYGDGEFKNLTFTPMKTGDVSYYTIIKEFIFNKNKRSEPSAVLPSVKTDLHSLKRSEDVLVWFGHSSYFIQIGGRRILVDPVFSGNASPVSFTTKSYKGSDIYTADDIPEIDYLLITHDHWDHLDYETIKKLQPKVKKVITGLGTGGHLEYWGYDKSIIIERDWFEEAVHDKDFSIHVTPARHFSGRLLRRNKTLWVSFAIRTSSQKIFVSGDTGYGTHFKTIGDKYGPFDLAIVDCGQYNESWRAIHMMPEETVQAAIDLGSKKMFPGHWSKFVLSLHDWDEPIIRATDEGSKRNIPVVHPMIGEPVKLNGKMGTLAWWEDLK